VPASWLSHKDLLHGPTVLLSQPTSRLKRTFFDGKTILVYIYDDFYRRKIPPPSSIQQSPAVSCLDQRAAPAVIGPG